MRTECRAGKLDWSSVYMQLRSRYQSSAPPSGSVSRRGGALLVVMWLAAALSAIAFTLAGTVRTETERTSTVLDGVRAYYLATGAIDRAALYMLWGRQFTMPDGSPRYYAPWMNALHFSFESGEARVEIIPDTSKMNINTAPPEDLVQLLLALGADPERANLASQAIVDWRAPRVDGEPGPFDQYYLSLTPSFPSRHASFQEVEELLLVRGVTPELFYGGFVRSPEGRLIRTGGLRDCVSVSGSSREFDVNTAHPAVLAASGLDPGTVAAIVETRSRMPFRSQEDLNALGIPPGAGRLRIGGNKIFTLRATARLQVSDKEFSDLRRSVAATVKLEASPDGRPYRVLRWYDNVWVQ